MSTALAICTCLQTLLDAACRTGWVHVGAAGGCAVFPFRGGNVCSSMPALRRVIHVCRSSEPCKSNAARCREDGMMSKEHPPPLVGLHVTRRYADASVTCASCNGVDDAG
jgi:hypothetical protein